MNRKRFSALVLFPLSMAIYTLASAADKSDSHVVPAGNPKSSKTKTLETGAKILQSNAPLKGFDIYLIGFHPMKDHPELQMEAHHYCHQMNEDFAQCVLFDSNKKDANLNGIEYIISEKLFNTLSENEKEYWHPHNGEILSGQLVAPGLPKTAEKALMKSKMNSYGKTWHVWNTGHEGHSGDQLPLGPPELAWSFNRSGEAIPNLIEKRDARLKITSEEKIKERVELKHFAKPQNGVDALKDKFSWPTRDIPAVIDSKVIETPMDRKNSP